MSIQSPSSLIVKVSIAQRGNYLEFCDPLMCKSSFSLSHCAVNVEATAHDHPTVMAGVATMNHGLAVGLTQVAVWENDIVSLTGNVEAASQVRRDWKNNYTRAGNWNWSVPVPLRYRFRPRNEKNDRFANCVACCS